jgi:hypothetical protein
VLNAAGEPICIGIPLNQREAEMADQVRALTRCVTDMEIQELALKRAAIDRATQPTELPSPTSARCRQRPAEQRPARCEPAPSTRVASKSRVSAYTVRTPRLLPAYLSRALATALAIHAGIGATA